MQGCAIGIGIHLKGFVVGIWVGMFSWDLGGECDCNLCGSSFGVGIWVWLLAGTWVGIAG